MKKGVNWKLLISCLIVVYLVAFVGSIFTSGSVNSSWYETIRPSITPPNWVFPIVWNILFFLIAISLYLSWNNSNKEKKKKLALVFGLNFVLNILWSVLYFGMQNPMLAFYEIIALWISIVLMTKVTYRINHTAGYLLVPYLLWVSFASVLNYLSAF